MKYFHMFLKFSISCFIHFFQLKVVIDSYFRTILEQDLPLTYSTNNPPAKRVVLIVVDGLKASAVYRSNTSLTPFLTSLIQTKASWGSSIGEAPTESRVGHVALIAGFREDPRAIITFWKWFPVEYNSVIELCNHAWVYPGSKQTWEVVERYSTNNAQIFFPQFPDGRPIIFGSDDWCVHTLETTLNNSKYTANLTTPSNLFVVLLPEVDFNGHFHSENYSRAVTEADLKIKKITRMVEKFFKDNLTSFIATADHGMLKRKHGGGSIDEISTPFIAWGAGIKPDPLPKNLDNIDVAPLISVLLGIPFPTNSYGKLPIDYLNTDNVTKLNLLSKNLFQLLIIFKAKQKNLSKSMFYQRQILNVEKLEQELLKFQQVNVENFDKSFNRCNIIHKEIKRGIQEIHFYLICDFIFLSFIYLFFWILYLLLSLIPDIGKEETSKIPIEMMIVIYQGFLLLLHHFFEMFIILCFLPLGTFYLFFTKSGKIRNVSKKSFQSLQFPGMLCFVLFMLLIQIALHFRIPQCLTSLSMISIIYLEKHIWTNMRIRTIWIILCIILSGFQFAPDIEYIDLTNYYYFYASLIWNFYIACILLNLFNNRNSLHLTKLQIIINFSQLFGSFCMSFFSFFNEDYQTTILFISSLVPVVLIPISMKSPDIRLVTIFMAFTTVGMAAKKPLFLILLAIISMFLFTWKVVETEKLNPDFVNFRNTWVLTGVNFVYIRLIKDISNIFADSGFRTPFAHVIRIFTPIILSCCVFRYLVPKTGVNFKYCFICMEVIFCISQFHCMSMIEKEGTWTEIGRTFMRFNIVNFFSIVIAFCYFLSYILMNIDFLYCIERNEIFG